MDQLAHLMAAVFAAAAATMAAIVVAYRMRGPAAYTAPLEFPNDSARLRACEESKRQAYYERNLAVCMFAKWLLANDENVIVARGYDEHFRTSSTALYIVTEELGQMVWHFHDEHAWMVDALGVPPYQGKWDGRTKNERHAVAEDWLRTELPGYAA
jgi:hypothetical protein